MMNHSDPNLFPAANVGCTINMTQPGQPIGLGVALKVSTYLMIHAFGRFWQFKLPRFIHVATMITTGSR